MSGVLIGAASESESGGDGFLARMKALSDAKAADDRARVLG